MYCFFYQDLQVLNYQCLAFCLSGATKRVIRIKEQPHPQLYTAKVQDISFLYFWQNKTASIYQQRTLSSSRSRCQCCNLKTMKFFSGWLYEEEESEGMFYLLSLSCNPCLWDNETFLPPTQSLESGTKIGKINTRGHDRRKMGLSCADN